jgi:hypothetical protein
MVQPKYNPEESLERVKLMMKYDTSKTLNENKEIIFEQRSDFAMDRQSNAIARSFGKRSQEDYDKVNRIIKKTEDNSFHVKGKTISEVLLKAREISFTTGGMVAQVVLSILGAEIGAPIVFFVLNIAILLNDLDAMYNEWRDTDLNPWSEEWFMFHLEDGPGMSGEHGNGFLRVLEDMLLIATGGVFKLLGKSAKGIYTIVKQKLGKNVGESVGKTSLFINSKQGYLNKLPKKIADYAKGKIGNAQKALELLKAPSNAAQSVKKNIPKAVIGGGLTYGFQKFFEKVILPKIERLIGGGVVNLTEDVPPELLQDLADTFRRTNPKLFPEKINKIELAYNDKKEFEKFIIDGSSYGVIDEKNYLLKKL